ncbi:DUF541 domain-containing protein [Fulvivirga sp. RKSG066]|uniref:SIMPL domain-containing protein n=1 Tax=Fulvivirga aurantia TaxID=2529383 RepID=UPI0012BB8662|nr:SIMPL domain-containing protein [Fulvivirga aurantia]MTI20814.1 DUF541 domain-containing protein [Fulvivirga aurantia]
MKKSLIIPILILLSFCLNAQDKTHSKSKSIEVKGAATMEVIPDEIFFRIALKEYKDGSRKIDINHLEKELVKAVEKLKIPEKNLQVENLYGYNWDWKKKKSDEFLATKSFIIKLSDVKQINELMSMIDPEGVNSSGINNYSHSQIETYKKELKIKALQLAKEKAEYLLAAIDEEIGGVLEVQEIEYGYQPVSMMRSSMAYAKEESADAGYQSNLEFKTITLSSEMRAVFMIK